MHRRISVPIPKFASFRGTSFANFGTEGHQQLTDERGFGSESPHDKLAARMMRTSEPPH
jgi:hypothetical protein